MTKIEWAHAGLGRGETWNPIRANNDPMGSPTHIGWHCEKVSPACANCYAERQNMAGARGGTRYPYKPAHRTNGSIQVYLDEKTLLAPLRWKAPRGIFVCSMTDIFGEWVLDEWLDKIFAIAALCPQHIFIYLTKRPARMRKYLSTYGHFARVLEARVGLPNFDHALPKNWPLPNVWLGVTVEDQQRADERRDDLRALAEKGWTTIVSYEPALGPVDWRGWEFVRQIIFGGETGPNARPPHPQWARDTRDFCASHRIAYFHKHNGEWTPTSSVDVYCHGPFKNKRLHPNSEGVAMLADGRICARDFSVAEHKRRIASKIAHNTRAIEVDGKALDDFHASIRDAARPIDNPLGYQWMYRVGKARAGHLLDGKAHHEFPEVAQ